MEFNKSNREKMIRNCWIVLAGISLTFRCQAQGIFNQKAGQIKNLIQQVALLEVYIGYVEKGYDIAKTGLTTISNIKHGDLQLHLGNFNALKSVNPKIGDYARVADIVFLQLQIVKAYKKNITQMNAPDVFTADEVAYVYNVFTSLLEQCAVNIDELIGLTGSGAYEMKDDERLKRIDAIAADMQDKYAFAQNFGRETLVLGLQRKKETDEVQTSRMLNNIKMP